MNLSFLDILQELNKIFGDGKIWFYVIFLLVIICIILLLYWIHCRNIEMEKKIEELAKKINKK